MINVTYYLQDFSKTREWVAVSYTVSTPDESAAAWQNTIESIIISDAVYSGCGAARHDKSLTVNSCRVLFMTDWHKVQIIFNSRFGASSVDTVLYIFYKVKCKHKTHLWISSSLRLIISSRASLMKYILTIKKPKSSAGAVDIALRCLKIHCILKNI